MQNKKYTIFELIDSSNPTKFTYIVLLISSLAYSLTAMNTMIVSGVANTIAREFNMSVTGISYFLSVGYAGMFFGAILFGKLADKVGRKTSLLMAIILQSLFTFLISKSSSYSELMIYRFLSGIGLGGALPIPGVLVSEYSPAKSRGKFVGLVETSWVYGVLIALFVTFIVMPSYGWRKVFIISLLPLALVPFGMIYLPESARFLLKKGKGEKALQILRRAYPGFDEKNVSLELAEKPVQKVTVVFSKKYLRRTLVLFVLWGGLVYTYHGIFAWLPTIYARTFNIPDVRSVWWTIAITLFQIPGYYSATFLLDRIGRKKVLAFYLFIAGFSSALLGLRIETAWIFAWSSVISFFNLGAWSGLYTYTPELYPTEIRGLGSGIAASFGRLISIFAPYITGYLYTVYGLSAPFIVFSFVHILASATVLAFGIETKKLPLQE